MHNIQEALLREAKNRDLGAMSLRQMAKLVGVPDKPQIVKHHLAQLHAAGLIQLDLKKGIIKPVNRGFAASAQKNVFYSLPIVGGANCGPATIFADERVEGYLKVSARMLPRRKQDLFVLVAEGNSMNRAEVRKGATIEDGDFVVVDRSCTVPKKGDIVVAVIDGMGTIKRYYEEKENKRVILQPESTEKFLPIFIDKDDNFTISGKVIDVIKKPQGT